MAIIRILPHPEYCPEGAELSGVDQARIEAACRVGDLLKDHAGRIWVDDRDLQIVKTRGKGVPETKINKPQLDNA